MQSTGYLRLVILAFVLMVLTLVATVIWFIAHPSAVWLMISVLFWSVLAILFLGFTYRSRCVGLLLSTFAILVVLRCLGVNGLYVLLIPTLIAFLVMLLLFLCLARYDTELNKIIASSYEWQLIFIRLYLGFNLIAHFSEKLFSGPVPFQQDVSAFVALHVPHPEFFVILAGLCEFGGAIAIGLGLITRLGALGISIYMMIATILGQHFLLGYIWASPGGGWEYPMLWTVLLLSFAVMGGGSYSLDGALKRRYRLPMWLQAVMG